jgi:hypothetical protein
MQEQADKLPPHYQQLIDAGVPGIDVMHGMLKLDILEAEARYTEAIRVEEANDYSDAMESMDRKYEEGFLDALTMMYKYTYDISFAISDREAGK